ncbi:hypothetical protein D3C76_1626000 [compost metagenome]
MNKTVPTGGVMRPIPQFRIMMMPKWTGSIPSAVATGRRIGVMIRIMGAISIGKPIRSSSRFIMNKMR